MRECPAVRSKASLSAGIAAVVASLVGGAAQAANIGWSTGPTDNTFSGINWTASATPSASKTVRANDGDNLFFAASTITTLNNDRTVNVAGAVISYGQLFFNASASSYTIGGNPFQLNGRIFNTSGNGTQTISNNFTLATGVAHAFQSSAGGTGADVLLNGVISGANALDTVTKNGGNTVTLSNANTFAGAVTVSQGVLSVTNSSGLGATTAGTTVANNAALFLSGGVTVGAEPLTITGGGSASVPNTGAFRNVSGNNTYGGAITIAAAPTRFTSNSGTLTLSGPTFNVSGNGRAILAGTIRVDNVIAGATTVSGLVVDSGANDANNPALNSLVTLAGANTFTGGTAINTGRVITANSTALGDGVVSVGATGATPTVATLTVGDGTVNTVGGINGLTISDGSTLELGAANSQIALDSGTFVLGNTNLDLNNLFNAAGTYVLIDGIDGANAIGATTFVDANTAGFNFAFGVVGNDGVLSVTAVPEPTTVASIGLGTLVSLRRRRTA